MIYMYGGEAARRRKAPFREGESDIDLFVTEKGLEMLKTYICQMPSARYQHRTDRKGAFIAIRTLIEGWKTIETTLITEAEASILLTGFPDETSLYNIPCFVSSLETDLIIKQAAIEHADRVNEKHLADIGDTDMASVISSNLPLYNVWCNILNEMKE